MSLRPRPCVCLMPRVDRRRAVRAGAVFTRCARSPPHSRPCKAAETRTLRGGRGGENQDTRMRLRRGRENTQGSSVRGAFFFFLPELCECEPLPAKAEAARLMRHEHKRQRRCTDNLFLQFFIKRENIGNSSICSYTTKVVKENFTQCFVVLRKLIKFTLSGFIPLTDIPIS